MAQRRGWAAVQRCGAHAAHPAGAPVAPAPACCPVHPAAPLRVRDLQGAGGAGSAQPRAAGHAGRAAPRRRARPPLARHPARLLPHGALLRSSRWLGACRAATRMCRCCRHACYSGCMQLAADAGHHGGCGHGAGLPASRLRCPLRPSHLPTQPSPAPLCCCPCTQVFIFAGTSFLLARQLFLAAANLTTNELLMRHK